MIYEKSCGAVIYRIKNSRIEYLIENMQKGHVSICKGHMEGNETEHQTAVREIMEETGLGIRFVNGFRETIHYSPYEGCIKEVVFFLAETDTRHDGIPQEIEVASIEWLPFEEAFKKLTHDSDRAILSKANAFVTMPVSGNMRKEANLMIASAIRECLPDTAVIKELGTLSPAKGKNILVAVGKAAWQMAKAAYESAPFKFDSGIVITKYGHANGPIGSFRIFEAGHPVPDRNTESATDFVLQETQGLTENDRVLFLLSGGGSSLFEKPLIPLDEYRSLTEQLLACGASITEINTVRKHLSAVKGGKFAKHCFPASVHAVILSDVLGNNPDTIASGPTVADSSTCSDALNVINQYGITVSGQLRNQLTQETPKEITNATFTISGSVSALCESAAKVCTELGYRPIILTDTLQCEAKDVPAVFMKEMAKNPASPYALIAGGETVVRLTGTGLGGRNQEMAVAFADAIRDQKDILFFSVGSDGTDGPTDAAGGIVDGETAAILRSLGISISDILQKNDSYHALEKVGGLIHTGPTGTNVNDLSVLLKR